jgi:hypothetical protein
LAAQNLEIAQRVASELELLHSKTAYVGGEQVESFEREFATEPTLSGSPFSRSVSASATKSSPCR